MSISYSARVVCGFAVDEVKEVTKDGPTKYNQDTGKPYTTQKYSHMELCIEDVCIAKADEFYGGMDIDGLELCKSGYEEGTQYLGLVLAIGRCGYGHDFDFFNPVVPEDIQEFAEKHGLTPRFFLVFNAC